MTPRTDDNAAKQHQHKGADDHPDNARRPCSDYQKKINDVNQDQVDYLRTRDRREGDSARHVGKSNITILSPYFLSHIHTLTADPLKNTSKNTPKNVMKPAPKPALKRESRDATSNVKMNVFRMASEKRSENAHIHNTSINSKSHIPTMCHRTGRQARRKSELKNMAKNCLKNTPKKHAKQKYRNKGPKCRRKSAPYPCRGEPISP